MCYVWISEQRAIISLYFCGFIEPRCRVYCAVRTGSLNIIWLILVFEAHALAQVVADISPRRPGFVAISVHVSFLVDKVSLCQVYVPALRFSPVSIIPPMLHTHSFTYHPRCIMFLSQYFSFPLSVSFHQCSIPIHSPTTHAV